MDFLAFAGGRAVVAKILVDEIEVLVSHENHIAAESFPHFDQVQSAAGLDAPHAAE